MERQSRRATRQYTNTRGNRKSIINALRRKMVHDRLTDKTLQVRNEVEASINGLGRDAVTGRVDRVKKKQVHGEKLIAGFLSKAQETAQTP